MTSCEWEYAHVAGACDVAFAIDGNDLEKIVTCGTDHSVIVRDKRTSEVEHNFGEHGDAVHALATAPNGKRVATASADYCVKIFSIDKGQFEGNVTRFTLPVHAVAWSGDGKYIAAGGEDGVVKVIDAEDKTIKCTIECPRSKCIKSLSFDPRGEFLAGSDDNGTVFVWVLKPRDENEEVGDAILFATEAPVATGESPLLNSVAWRPDGAVLAVPGRENDVTFFERETFKQIEWEMKGHTEAISLIRWSPNGKYLVTASDDKTVICWDVKKKLAIAKITDTSELVCGAAFSTTGNSMALIKGNGEWAMWDEVVPSKYTSPTASVALSEIDFKSELVAKNEFIDDEVDDMEDNAEEEEDDDDGFVEYDTGKSHYREKVVHVEAGPKPQPAFQPGSVAAVPGTNRRFLSYTMTGSLVATTEGEFSSIEFQFHDTSRLGRIPVITDTYGYTLGVAGEKGCALASPMKDTEQESTLYFHPYDSWVQNSEWQMTMLPGEDILCIATGSSWVAAATSKRYLRVYSLGGAQRQVISLEGDVVSIAGHDDSLGVVWHEAAPIGPAPGDQVLAYAVYNMRHATQLARGRLPLSHQAKLTYMGFSEEGMLLIGDSAGVVRMRTEAFGGSFTPVFRSSAARATDGQHHWIVSASASTLFCIITRTSAGPTPSPRPVLSMLPLSVPIITPEQSVTDLEDEAARANFALMVAQSSGEDARLAMGASEKAAIKLFHAACKSQKLSRASDIAETFRQPNSLRAVLKLPAVSRQPALVERIHELIETAVDPEPTQGYTQPESYTPAPTVRSTPSTVAKTNPLTRKNASVPAVDEGNENKDVNELGVGEGKRDFDGTPTPSKAKKSKVVTNPFARG